MVSIKDIDFKKQKGLVPAIIQEEKTGEILMLGYMNEESLKQTLEKGYAVFWSRSRKELWLKGETSGNRLKVKDVLVDCDQDTLLIKVDLEGSGACHTGNKSCFFEKVK